MNPSTLFNTCTVRSLGIFQRDIDASDGAVAGEEFELAGLEGQVVFIAHIRRGGVDLNNVKLQTKNEADEDWTDVQTLSDSDGFIAVRVDRARLKEQGRVAWDLNNGTESTVTVYLEASLIGNVKYTTASDIFQHNID